MGLSVLYLDVFKQGLALSFAASALCVLGGCSITINAGPAAAPNQAPMVVPVEEAPVAGAPVRYPAQPVRYPAQPGHYPAQPVAVQPAQPVQSAQPVQPVQPQPGQILQPTQHPTRAPVAPVAATPAAPAQGQPLHPTASVRATPTSPPTAVLPPASRPPSAPAAPVVAPPARRVPDPRAEKQNPEAPKPVEKPPGAS